MPTQLIPYQPVAKSLLIINMFMALIYFAWWFFPGHVGNPYLYYALLFGEVYHLFMAFTFWYAIWPKDNKPAYNLSRLTDFYPKVDVFVTVAGEPVEIVKHTVLSCKQMDYPNFDVYILNDGYVAKKDNWQDMVMLAKELGVHCITRQTPGGAKAGNINNALMLTKGEIVVIFDADMAPDKEFLRETVQYFADEKIGFVQTPQYYKNRVLNNITSTAWEQQAFFFGPIMRGKAEDNSAFICGTNVAIRRKALYDVNGLAEDNIAEDFLTSLLIHQKGWHSVYIPEVLAQGLAPEDLLSYFKQQLRWSRGSLEIAFSQNPFFKRHLTWRQRIQYISSALYYFNGFVVLIDMLMPLIFLFTGIQPVNATTTSFALFFIPFMFLSLYTLYVTSKGYLTFRAISFSLAAWTIQLTALFSLLIGRKIAFAVTPKQAVSGNFLHLAYPHLIYILLTGIGSFWAVLRMGISPAVATNIVWALFNIILFLPFINAAYPWGSLFSKTQPTAVQNEEI